MIAIIDYDAGNVKSVQKALAYLHEDTILTRDPKQLLAAEKVILPGVGAFGDAMGKLKEYGLIDVISEIVDKNTPFLGICLGLQLLFESSEESPGVEGLGILKGKILRIPEQGKILRIPDGVTEDKRPLKIPHIGWNSLSFPQKGRLFEGFSRGPYVYFVHSYYLKAEEDIVTARTEYGVSIDASVEKGNLFACQFHPEKSSEAGLKILESFVRLGREGY